MKEFRTFLCLVILGCTIWIGIDSLHRLFAPLLHVSAQQTLTFFTVADITGTGAAVAVGTTQTAKFCQLVALSTNTSHARWGDSSITASRGADMAPGGGQFVPQQPVGGAVINLSSLFVFVANGDKMTVTCAI